MKRRCNICSHENGSCNQYITRDGRGITICPSCLVWSKDPRAVMARLAHGEGRLVKPVKETTKWGKKK